MPNARGTKSSDCRFYDRNHHHHHRRRQRYIATQSSWGKARREFKNQATRRDGEADAINANLLFANLTARSIGKLVDGINESN